MKTKTHSMRVVSLFAIGVMILVIIPFTKAYAYTKGTRASGTAKPLNTPATQQQINQMQQP